MNTGTWNVFSTPDFVIVQYIQNKVAVKSVCIPATEPTPVVRNSEYPTGTILIHKTTKQEYVVDRMTDFYNGWVNVPMYVVKKLNDEYKQAYYPSQMKYLFEKKEV